MRRFRAIAVVSAVLLIAAAPARSETALPAALQVLGTVTSAARPVANALVIALNLQDLAATQTRTTVDGSFTLPGLRAGVYRIIAVKQGFAPTIATIVPNQPSHRIALRLDTEQDARRKGKNQEIWELRGSLPADVLRELELALEPAEVASYEVPRFRGEMLSVTGVADTPASPAFAQTALGVQGRIGDSWQVGIRGNLQRFEDPTENASLGAPAAESSVMSMELRSSASRSYRVASTRSSWMYLDPVDGEQQAAVRAHNFEWQQGDARVQVRYFEQDNLFRDTALGSNLIEVAGNVPIVQTRRNDFGVSIRVTQESVDNHARALRLADVSADGTLFAAPTVVLHYGMASRIALDGQEWAPRTGAEWKLTKNTSVIGSALYKVVDHEASPYAMPSLVFWTEDSHVLPRYAYTFGFVSGKEGENRFSAIATVSAVDDPLRVVFADEQNQFWDGLYVESGDVRRDVRVAYRRQFGKVIAVDVSTTAGTATSHDKVTHPKVYVAGDLQSTFNPTRTTLAVSYREIQQPADEASEDYRSERLNLRMAQSLYLPVDLKLLLGLELARAENSPYAIDLNADGTSKKYIGGLALNF